MEKNILEKNKTFKLDQIAPANSINHLAHDAFGDVMATKQLAQLISKRKPSFWQSFLDGASKSRVYNTLSEEKMVFLCQTFYGKTTPISGTFLFSHPVYNFPVLFDLNYDPQDLIELNLKDLRDIYISGQKFLKFVKPNKGPILLKKKQVEDSWFFNSININEFQNSLSFFPNPTTGIINIIKNNTEITYVTILNVFGKKIYSNNLSKSLKIDLSLMKNGVYFIEFSNGKERIIERLILNR